MGDLDALLFKRSILDDYVKEVKKTSLLNKITLLNIDMFNTWFYPRNSKIISRPSRTGYILRQSSENMKEKLYQSTIQVIADDVCRNIGLKYAKSAVHRGFNDTNFDIIVAVPSDSLDNDNTYKSSSVSRATEQNHKLKQILGFLIAEKGECTKLRDVWSVNLICTRDNSKIKIKGQILMGCYLHAIKMNNDIDVRNKTGILELAGGFTNTAGFFSYYKSGFNVDLSLYGNDCFLDDNNLPMSIDLSQFSENDIISMATKSNYRASRSDRKFEFKNDYGLFALGLPIDNNHAKIQYKVAEICNDIYRNEIEQKQTNTNNHRLSSDLINLHKNLLHEQSRYSIYRNNMIIPTAAAQSMSRSSSHENNIANIDSTNVFASLLNSCYKGICENFGFSIRTSKRKITGGKPNNTRKYKNKYKTRYQSKYYK